MRIAVVTPDLREPGGIVHDALLVARSLRCDLGAEVRLISLATSSHDAASLVLHHPRTWKRHAPGTYTHEEIPVEHFGAVATDIEWARYAQRRLLLDRVSDCDALHVIGGTPAWGHAVRGFRGPLVIHFASFAHVERTGPMRSPVDAWRRLMTRGVTALERKALRRADVILTMNDTRRREAARIAGGTTPVFTAHTGVDTQRFVPGPYQPDGYLLAVGRLSDPRKNIPLLLRAYAEARRQFARIPRLVLVGHRPPSAESWQLIAELGLSHSVEYRGAVSRAELPSTYQGASAFVLSSDEEGLGIVVLEALASGLPVIATACIGPTETVTHGREGMLVPVGSVERLADAILRVTADEALRQRMSEAARRRAVQEFSLEQAAGRLVAAYREAGILRPAHTGAVSRSSTPHPVHNVESGISRTSVT
jgi:glycosyltransferase involved in cell wall biosynthesis